MGWDYLPFRFRPITSYQFLSKWIEIEMIIGAHLYLGDTFEYSEMVRHGVMGGVELKSIFGIDYFLMWE